MKFLQRIIFAFICLSAFNVWAKPILSKKKNASQKVSVATFADFFPFGYRQLNERNVLENTSVLKNVLEKTLSEEGYILKYKNYEDTTKALSEVRLGNCDIFLGMYYSTEAFNGIEYIFPAVINNPVHLMMLPEKIAMIKKVDDLKSLNGIYNSKEYFSDFMIQNFSRLNIKPVLSSDEAFEKLLTGQVDYIVGGYYYSYMQVLQTGLKDYIAFSSKALWNMPLFIGISKTFPGRAVLTAHLVRAINNPTFKEQLNADLRSLIKKAQEDTIGIVPPKYVHIPSNNELTPADEALLQGQQ